MHTTSLLALCAGLLVTFATIASPAHAADVELAGGVTSAGAPLGMLELGTTSSSGSRFIVGFLATPADEAGAVIGIGLGGLVALGDRLGLRLGVDVLQAIGDDDPGLPNATPSHDSDVAVALRVGVDVSLSASLHVHLDGLVGGTTSDVPSGGVAVLCSLGWRFTGE